MAQYRQPKRKFHDAWAFILFVIATLVANFVYVTAPKEEKATEVILNYRIAAYSAIYFISCCFISNILLLTIPFYLMHISFILLPIISVTFALLSNNMTQILLSFVFGFISLLSYFFVRKHIKYSAVICKAVTRIVNQYIVTIPLIILSFALIIFQIVFTAMNLKTNNYVFYLIGLLQMYWTYFAVMYFIRVFVSSIVSLHVFDKTGNISNDRNVGNRNTSNDRYSRNVGARNENNRYSNIGSSRNDRNSNHSSYSNNSNSSNTYTNTNTSNVTILSIKNTLFSLGPICFGSLLVAIVSVLEHLQRESRNRERGTGASILYAIVGFLLALLREIIEYANSWAYIYIALYGTNYIGGIKGAYELVMKRNNKIFVNNLCIMSVLNLLSVMCLIIYLTGSYYVLDNFNDLNLLNIVLFACCGMIFMAGYLSTFDSAGKAFLFAYDCDKEEVMKKYPKEYEVMEEQLRKTRG